MLKSMTAYGRASSHTKLGRFVVEIQSLNRKYLEFGCSLPKELVRFDSDIKKWVGSVVSRGQINIKVSVSYDTEAPLDVTPNLPLARKLKAAWEAIATDLGLEGKGGFSLDLLKEESNILCYEEHIQDEAGFRSALEVPLKAALKNLMDMKLREGEELEKDIAQRLRNVRKWMEQIHQKAPGATEKYRLKLVERIHELTNHAHPQDVDERLMREVCSYAEKVDIAEEITRFTSHLKQFENLLVNSAEGVGKPLEFLIQELNREANTVGSKTSEVEISHLVVEIKSELERIREQIQNVE